MTTASRRLTASSIGLALLLAACGGSSTSTGSPPSAPASAGASSAGGGSPASPTGTASPTESAVSPESPVPPESNPPGDIPDNTQFIPFRSASGHFQMQVPEGWARSTTKGGATFSDKLNLVNITVFSASSAPTVASARSHDVPELKRTERAFHLRSVKAVTLPGGHAVLITFQANSAPNQVTGKQYRLDVLRFEFFRSGREAGLTLSSPVGADNVDPWRLISESFRWM